MKNVLVLGGNGFLGRHILKYLIKDLSYIIYAPLNRVFFNLEDYKSILEYAKFTKFDYIFHCAVYFKPGNFSVDGENYIYNEIINNNVLRYFWEYQRQATLITFGSDAAYNPSVERIESNYLSKHPSEDYYGYALSKRNLYQGLLQLEKQDNSIKFLHLPIISLYGADYKRDDDHLIHSILRKAVEAKYHSKMAEFWGDGNQIREIVYVDDLVKNIFSLLEKNVTGIYNLGSDIKSRTTINYYINTIFNKIGTNDYCYNLDAKKGLFIKTLNNQKAMNVLGNGYKDTKFEDTLDEIIDYSVKLYK